MIWDMKLVKKIADFNFIYVIDLDDMVDMSEGITLDGAMDAYLTAVKAEIPEAKNMGRVNLETDATRDHARNWISVVIRWGHRAVKSVWIPSEDKLFVPSWPVGPSSGSFRLPIQASATAIFREFRYGADRPIEPEHKTYTIRGFDDTRQAWVYEEEGVPLGARLFSSDYPKVQARGRASAPGARVRTGYDKFNSDQLRRTVLEERHTKTLDQLREELGLEPMKQKKALKDMPVRESGLGIW